MIKDNTISFGHGSVAIMAQPYTIRFQEINPPAYIGNDLKDMDISFIGEEKILNFNSYKDIILFEEMLWFVKKGTLTRFSFQELNLDFSHYNPASVDIVLSGVEKIKRTFLFSMAC